MIPLHRSLALAVVLAWTTAVTAAPGPLDLIPAEPVCAVAVRNLADLKKKGEKFLTESGLKIDRKPSDLMRWACEQIGLEDGAVDENGAAAVLITGLAPVIIVPFTDRDRLAEKLGLKKGELKADTVTATKLKRGQWNKYAYVRGSHVYLGEIENQLEFIARAKTMRGALSADRVKALDQADVLVNLAISSWPDVYPKDAVERIVKEMTPEGDAEKKTARQVAEALISVRSVLLALRVGDGLGLDAVAVFPKDNAAARKLLAALGAGKGTSDLKGLPTGKVLAANADRNDNSQNVFLARLVIKLFLRYELETNHLLSAKDRPLVTGVFTELWKHLRGRKLAIYQNADETKNGLFSTVLILDTDDPKKFLTEIADLARFAEGKNLDLTDKTGKSADLKSVKQLIRDLGDDSFPVRENASTKLALIGEPALPLLEKATSSDDAEVARRASDLVSDIKDRAASRRKELLDKTVARPIRPGFVLKQGAETLDGQKIDVVHVRLDREEASAVKQMQQLLGPDWHKIRLVVVGKQVIVLIGSDVALLKQTLKNVKEGLPGLAADKSLAAFNKHAHSGRKFELHVSLAALDALTAAEGPDLSKLKAGAALSSLAATVETDRVELNLWLPMDDIKRLVKARGW